MNRRKLLLMGKSKPLVEENLTIKRISSTSYEVSETNSSTLLFKNIDTGQVITKSNVTTPYIFNHNTGERYEVSIDGNIWTPAWGIYLNGTNAYLEALDINEMFENASGMYYRKLEFTPLRSSAAMLWINHTPPYNRSGGESYFYSFPKFKGFYWNGETNISGGFDVASANELYKVEVIEGGHLYVNDVQYNEIPLVSNKVEYNYKFSIGKYYNGGYTWFKGLVWGVELGTHVGQMNGQGTQIIDQNGEPFLNMINAIWQKI